ncbi:MAG: COG1470 family protein, partial [Planctomycetota bacterium]
MPIRRTTCPVVKAAGGRNRALVREFDRVEVSDDLVIELVPKADNPTPEQLPILQGVEIVRRRVLSLGCATPQFELSSIAPRQSGRITLSNLRERTVVGTLHMAAQDGFDVSPRQTEIKLAAGQRMTIPVKATVTGDVPAGEYRITVKL